MYRLTIHIDHVNYVEREIVINKEKKVKKVIYNTLSVRDIPSLKEVERRLSDIRERYGIRKKQDGTEMYNIVIQ
jgi:hypothetical protein